jgi:glycosyltransferase involved in cell wall biosynthesis
MRWIRQFKPDIVHTQTSKAGFVGRLAARLAGVPVVIHIAHAFPFHPYLSPFVRTAYVAIERMTARWADCLYVDTQSVREDGLRARVVDDASKIVVVPMGVNLERFSPTSTRPIPLREVFQYTSEAPVVGTVARLVPDKGLECFLQMASLVHKSRPDTRFLVVGERPLRPELEPQSRSLGLEPHVIFAGPRTDIPDRWG